MADYVPIHNPGHEFTQQASATIVGGNTLANSGVGTVAPAITASANKYVGVAAHDAASGAKVTVIGAVGAVHETTAAGAISAGALVIVGAVSGTIATIGAGTFDQAIGIALTTAADTAVCRWKSFR
jgi:hypothetical protein